MSANGSRPKLAMYWAAGCGGCEIAVLNLHEKILDVAATFDIVFWPVAVDTKYRDVEAMPDGAIFLTLFNGGIRNTENEALAHLLRRKSQLLVAFGACACAGGIPGLANLDRAQALVDTAFDTVSTDNPGGVRPQPEWAASEGQLHLPALQPWLKTLDQVVPVDYYIPGCPPEPRQIASVIDRLLPVLAGQASLPARGATLGAGHSTVCDECHRRREAQPIREFVRLQSLAAPDPARCLLEQGVPCNGIATRSGCGALCPAAGAPCIGCYGPAEGVADFGARLMSAYASVIDGREPLAIEHVLDGLPDPAGQFYRFGLAHSLLGSGRAARQD